MVFFSTILIMVVYFVQDVLEGNWTGDFRGGVRPGLWNGSVSILAKYLKGQQIVQFGQCWVFSGVLTTGMKCNRHPQ